MRLLILISFLVLFSIKSENLRQTSSPVEIEIPFLDSRLLFPIRIGTRPQFFMLVLDTTSFHMWLGNHTVSKNIGRPFRPQSSNTFEETKNKNVYGTNQKGNEVLDFIQITDNMEIQKKFSFLLLNILETQIGRFDGVIGFSRDFKGNFKLNTRRIVNANPRFSLIQYLETNKIIDNKIFGIKFLDRGSAKLYLGASGSEKENYPTCVPHEKEKDTGFYHNWNCAYNGMALRNGEEIYSFNETSKQTVEFESAYDGLQVTPAQAIKIFKVIQKTVGVPCVNKTLKGNTMALFCPKELQLNKVPDLIIKIEGFDYIIPGKEIFEQSFIDEKGGSFGFMSKIVGDKNNKKLLRIGINFMKYYHLVFDYDKGSVGFAEFVDIFLGTNSQKGFMPRRWKRPWSVLEKLAVVLSIFIILAVAYYLYFRRKNRKKVVTHTKEKLIEPIGKPMVNKN